jgi:tetratricopeptide (TPR) repeat protein
VFRKRRIAILIAKGERNAAIRELNKYLDAFGTDTEAWLQLSDLFLQEADYGRAVYCFEELLLSNVISYKSLNSP